MSEQYQQQQQQQQSNVVREVVGSITRYDSNEEDVEIFLEYHRKVWALLFLVFLAVLLLVSPFCLADRFVETIVIPLLGWLKLLSLLGIIFSFVFIWIKGRTMPYAPHITLGSLVFFVSLQFGLLLADKSWAPSGLVAIGQATLNFAVILALMQLETEWLSYKTAPAIALVLSVLWFMVLIENHDTSVKVSIYVSFGGWLFFLLFLVRSKNASQLVFPEEYVLGTLLIMVPGWLLFLGTRTRQGLSERRPVLEQANNDGEEERPRYATIE